MVSVPQTPCGGRFHYVEGMVNDVIDDPIVEEIHRYRKVHAAQYGNDLNRIVEALREFERTSGREYVNFEPSCRVPAVKASEEAVPYDVSTKECP